MLQVTVDLQWSPVVASGRQWSPRRAAGCVHSSKHSSGDAGVLKYLETDDDWDELAIALRPALITAKNLAGDVVMTRQADLTVDTIQTLVAAVQE